MTIADDQNGQAAAASSGAWTPWFLASAWAEGLRSSVARRFAFWTILCSTVLALLMTSVQLAADFHREKHDQDEALGKIEVSILPSLAESVWLLDDTLIRSQLAGIARIEGVNKVEITGAGISYRTAGEASATGYRVELPILRLANGRTDNLGQLVIHADYSRIWDLVLSRALVILATNCLKTAVVSLAILLIFQRLVGRHLSSLSRFASSYDPEKKGQRLALDTGWSFPGGGGKSEFDTLESAINRWSEATETYTEQLRNANREQAEFTYAISHDLKSPVNTMAMLIDELAEDGAPGGEAREILGDMRATNARMGALVDDVLGYARLVQSGFEAEPVDLATLAQDVVKDLAADIRAADASIETGRLPVVCGHPAQLRLLFQNLIANAVKFRKPGVKPIVRLTAETRADCFAVTVADNGIGVPKEHRDKVFGLFKRLHERSAYEGSGIGLATCRRVISNHGGEISIQDGLDCGTAILMTLPRSLNDETHSAGGSDRR
ncbi:ATP-binding protein [Leisingera sp. SS27]|uniref:sensor histidine kinase n=1 Tax=Leisingera sp. SS27 TaxID=2979462 RepID=UPI00232FAC02|nr:ATP-binding protein [Leisingera sp. SS27]MDC0658199.1 ATP-binding protein [Leisingera sp. SS27]